MRRKVYIDSASYVLVVKPLTKEELQALIPEWKSDGGYSAYPKRLDKEHDEVQLWLLRGGWRKVVSDTMDDITFAVEEVSVLAEVLLKGYPDMNADLLLVHPKLIVLLEIKTGQEVSFGATLRQIENLTARIREKWPDRSIRRILVNATNSTKTDSDFNSQNVAVWKTKADNPEEGYAKSGWRRR